MRLYIHTTTKNVDQREPTYTLTKAIEGAWHWTTLESADRICRFLSQTGITINVQNGFGDSVYCTDYRVESRPQGGFAISCEHPLSAEKGIS